MRNIFYSFIILSLLFLSSCSFCAKEKNYAKSEGLLQYVDPYIGSGYHGHVFVGTSTPFGMVQLGPSNIYKGWDWSSGYHYSDSIMIGFAHTHLSGTGCTDLGDILLMPYTGDICTIRGNQHDISNGYASFYQHQNEIARPEYYSVLLDRYNVKAELTASDRVGFHRYTFPDGEQARIIIDLKEGNGDTSYDTYIKQIDEYTLEGYRFSRGWSTHKVFFTLKTNVALKDFHVFYDTTPKEGKELKGPAVKGVLTWGDRAGEVMLKVSLSSVSCENAAANIESEITHWNFDKIVAESSKKWNRELNKIRIETSDEAVKRTFYTALYHTMVAPSLYSDSNGEFRLQDDKVYTTDAKNYSTFSLWDTYRTAHPLMTIIHPEKQRDIINSMLAIYQQQGKLPVWHLQGYETHCMVGNPGVIVVADALLKGYDGFDKELAYEAMKNSMMLDERGLKHYRDLGYIPYDKEHEALSKAMEYAIADWAVAAVAKKMGKEDDHAYFLKRSKTYQYYFDKETNFVRGLAADGTFRPNFNPFTSIHREGDYVEGNAWQYTWLVPHDVKGLIDIFKGEQNFIQELDKLFQAEGDLGEHASADMTGLVGQYVHGNEPSHHIIYLYAYVGEQWKTAEKVRFIMDNFYTDKQDGIIGNEDCGQMSAWYIMSALGFYPVNPSQGIYVFGSPYMDKATVNLQNNKEFTVEAVDNSKENIYIQRIELNGVPYTKSYITHEDIAKGGTLKYFMGSQPNKEFGAAMEDRPF
ncbi:GH92 family glycosyl hydrolase [Bacteroides sp. 224]|uniref:GH92 family glycosyl hydrolase n=1 Tax=Bacteroides sp. 224 TaxID=2302936 RepID=UPI0013D34C86|nr:GH92 family glycosyl hydrolase [Bacteroides sp. 224]NDV63667.1 glycoside hydrolase family 92 protein [Bacteroides sp. 224]